MTNQFRFTILNILTEELEIMISHFSIHFVLSQILFPTNLFPLFNSRSLLILVKLAATALFDFFNSDFFQILFSHFKRLFLFCDHKLNL